MFQQPFHIAMRTLHSLLHTTRCHSRTFSSNHSLLRSRGGLIDITAGYWRRCRATRPRIVPLGRFIVIGSDWADFTPIENEIVLLRHKTNSSSKPVLTTPLLKGKKLRLGQDTIYHDAIIGKSIGRDIVNSSRGVQYRLYRPTLGEYTDNSPRIVTPIYSHDADLIVSLLDLHPTAGGGEDLEIFEAGTGHGALTLHLARAIHAANFPRIDSADHDIRVRGTLGKVLEALAGFSTRSSRRAVIHTLDISAENSQHARKTVKNFRGGLYLPNIDFHVSTVDTYLNSRLAESDLPFLDHAILDLPGTHDYLDIVAKSMKENGKLVTFCPSITQINASVLHVKEHKVPFFLENVLEIGGAVGVGGREWDVRPVLPRRFSQSEVPTKVQREDERSSKGDIAPDSRWEIICRPKVGARVIGGGFVGVWRRMAGC